MNSCHCYLEDGDELSGARAERQSKNLAIFIDVCTSMTYLPVCFLQVECGVVREEPRTSVGATVYVSNRTSAPSSGTYRSPDPALNLITYICAESSELRNLFKGGMAAAEVARL